MASHNYHLSMLLPIRWQHNILRVVSLLEQRRNLIIGESCNATAHVFRLTFGE